MIIIRRLDETGSEIDQDIFCGISCFEEGWYSHFYALHEGVQDPHETLILMNRLGRFNVYLNVSLNGWFLIEPNLHPSGYSLDSTISDSPFPTLKDFLVVVKGRPDAHDFQLCSHCQTLIDSRLQEGAYDPYEAWANGIQPYNKAWEKEETCLHCGDVADGTSPEDDIRYCLECLNDPKV
mgnify:FL=1